MIKVNLNEGKCSGCETCVKVCPSKVFEVRAGKVFPLNIKACIGCKICEIQCPNYAIKISYSKQS
ncbi:MAG: 4Fe-4S binding protein [Nitrososphaeria archaeon]|nr:4Fe-4S binding protein [Nitrososphaeria archaeon]